MPVILDAVAVLAPQFRDGAIVENAAAAESLIEQQVLVTEDGCEVLSGDLPDELWRAVP